MVRTRILARSRRNNFVISWYFRWRRSVMELLSNKYICCFANTCKPSLESSKTGFVLFALLLCNYLCSISFKISLRILTWSPSSVTTTRAVFFSNPRSWTISPSRAPLHKNIAAAQKLHTFNENPVQLNSFDGTIARVVSPRHAPYGHKLNLWVAFDKTSFRDD